MQLNVASRDSFENAALPDLSPYDQICFCITVLLGFHQPQSLFISLEMSWDKMTLETLPKNVELICDLTWVAGMRFSRICKLHQEFSPLIYRQVI